MTLAPPPDFEFAGVVDDSFHPQDLAELVIHLQPVVLHPVFDAGTGMTILLSVRQHFALEVAVQLAAQEGEDVLGGEVDRGVIQEPRIKLRQVLAGAKQHVGAVFELVDDPPILHASQPGHFLEERIDLLGPAAEPTLPSQAEEAVGLPLGGLGIVQFQEAVVPLHKARPLLGQLLCQPIVSVHVNLDREREPGLDPHMYPTKLRVEKIVVQHSLRAAGERQAGLTVAITELHRAAALQAAQDSNQAAGQLPLADGLVDQFLCGVLALEILIRSAFPSGCRLGVLDQPL